ncbi:hypothetical protein [Cytobacillus sp. NCCP-133]|uniref:hypothetical protein n=1 Tax=Cytobacillus sp. NCCP-133 TaxID=766848 RepID=UPI0022315AA8|nr:hypothetical protein [Cytobacillus sp. NCCP-133]
MGRNLVFHIPAYTSINSAFPKPINDQYDYWMPLINYFLSKADTIEFHCWNEENKVVEEIKCLNINKIEMQDITIFKGEINSALTGYLLNQYLDDNNNFKWFTVDLIHDKVPVCHSGHWGTEFFVPNAQEKDAAMIKKAVSTETSLHQY